jgi:tRNA-dihydrouridine synthase A
MAQPDLVAECLTAMQRETDAPVTVKSRIGIDDRDDYGFLRAFVEPLHDAGCRKFVVHARIAILEGLSPKENRTVPPLDYEHVYTLKRDFPDCEIVINGGLTTIAGVDAALAHVDGAMIGRQAYHQPYLLAELEAHRNRTWRMPSRAEVVSKMLPYIDNCVAGGVPLNSITRHMLGLYAGQPGARTWRRYISEHAHRPGASSDVLSNALDAMPAASDAATMHAPATNKVVTQT